MGNRLSRAVGGSFEEEPGCDPASATDVSSTRPESNQYTLKEPTGELCRVFINHTGEQKRGIVDFLQQSFQAQYPMLNFLVGEDTQFAGDGHRLSALEDAFVGVLVLSMELVSTPALMAELHLLLERQRRGSRAQLLPVLYEMSRVEVMEKVKEYESAHTDTLKQCWANDLQELLSINVIAQDQDTTTTSGLSLVRLVVERTAELLAGMNQLPVTKPEEMPEITVGLDEAMKKITGLLFRRQGRPTMLVLTGMGGIGKTTLAKAVFNHEQEKHSTALCYFLRMDPLVKGSGAVVEKQKELLKGLACMASVKVNSAEDGRQQLLGALKGKRVLLVVDNVWGDQLDLLLPHDLVNVLGTGSVVLVTSRESGVADRVSAQWAQEVEVDFLSEADSLELLCWHAYHSSSSSLADSSAKLLQQLVARCVGPRGLPMALEVVGKRLARISDRQGFLLRTEEAFAFGHDGKPEVVEKQLASASDRQGFLLRTDEALAFVYSAVRAGRLEKHRTVFEELQLSWDVLAEGEKESQESLLDIVWFPRRQEWELVRCYCGHAMLERLHRISLVERLQVEGKSKLKEQASVHPVIVDFCKLDVSNRAQGHRLELCAEDCGGDPIWEELSRVSNVRGLHLREFELDADGCRTVLSMEELRVLWLSGCSIPMQQPSLSLAGLPSLGWLLLEGSAGNSTSLLNQSLQLQGMGRLAVLVLDSMLLERLQVQDCTALRALSIGSCPFLSQVDLGGLTGLEHLQLRYCNTLQEDSVASITECCALTYLDIAGCHLLHDQYWDGADEQQAAAASTKPAADGWGTSQAHSEIVPDTRQSSSGSAASTSYQAAARLPLPDPADAARLPLKRQVSISHTGQDQGAKTFAASILRPALEAAGLAVYMDSFNLELGADWRQELVDAAANSMVVVVVLSRSYTKRFWCMLELDLALHSHQQQGEDGGISHNKPRVIPVFYDSPDEVMDVASIRQYWADTQQRLMRNDEPNSSVLLPLVDVSRWSTNISHCVSSLQFMRRNTFSTGKDEEMNLARQVVNAAVKLIPRRVAVGDVVGFEEQEAALAAQLGGRLGLWLYGQGGRGKSTIAKMLFNRLAGSFSHRAFIEIQVGDGADKTAQLLADALKALGATADVSEGSLLLSQKLNDFVKDQKALFVLDNVWTAGQLTALLPTQWGHGSVVIVTSRNKTFADSDAWRKVQKNLYHHEVAALDEDAARQLFQRAAGLEGGPPAGLQALEDAILEACGGLPLALLLTGGQLYEEADVANWQGALKALKQGHAVGDSEGRLVGVLAHSLAGLLDGMVSMFLDVATILLGEPLELVMAVWHAWHGPAAAAYYKELRRRSLLGADATGSLVMDGVLVALGRGIVLHPRPGLEVHFGSRLWVDDGKVVGLQQAKSRPVVAAQLDVGDAEEQRRVKQQLQSLDLSSSRILCLGQLDMQPPEGVLWLEHCLTSSVQYSPQLMMLAASMVQSMDLKDATALRRLVVNKCEDLVDVGGLGELRALRQLEISDCTNLQGWGNLRELTALRQLAVRKCGHVGELDLHHNTALEQVDLASCEGLQKVAGLRGLGALRSVTITSCNELEGIDVQHLSGLEQLEIAYCKNMQGWGSLRRLAGLRRLRVSCERGHVEELDLQYNTALEEVELTSCQRLLKVAGLAGLEALHSVTITSCDDLKEIDLDGLVGLRQLEINSCSGPELLDGRGRLAALTSLTVTNMLKSEHIDFSGCRALEKISIGACWALKAMRLAHCHALVHLNVGHCNVLDCIDLGGLAALTALHLRRCHKLEQIGVKDLTSLEHLTLLACEVLTQLEGLAELEMGLAKQGITLKAEVDNHSKKLFSGSSAIIIE